MRDLLTLASVLLAAAMLTPVAAATAQGPDPAADYTELPVGPRPESVARGFDGRLFVSIQGPDNTATVADGEVRVIDGTSVTTFATGLYEPKGMAFVGGYLFVADLARVWRIDATGSKVAVVDDTAVLPKRFFNDVAPAPGGDGVLVVEMGSRDVIRDPSTTPPVFWPLGSPQAAAIPVTARVYRLSLDGTFTSVIGPTADILIPNGVTRGGLGSTVYVTDFFNGRIVRVNGRGRTHVVAAGEQYRGADGLALDRRYRFYVSSFESGQVFQVGRSGKRSRLLVDLGRNGAADLMYDVGTNAILMPSTSRGSLVTIPLPRGR